MRLDKTYEGYGGCEGCRCPGVAAGLFSLWLLSFVRVFAVRRSITQQILRSVEAQLHSVFTLEQPALRCSLLSVMLLETPQVIVMLLFSAGNLLFLECTGVQPSMSS